MQFLYRNNHSIGKRFIQSLPCIAIGLIVFAACKKEYSCEQNCLVTNQLPVAQAGINQTIVLPVDSIMLDGSASKDPDGTIKSYQWTKIAGPASFTIKNTTAAKTAVNKLLTGSYLFELKVTDNGGLFATDTMQVVVNDPSQPNRPPVAKAGNDTVINLPASADLLNGSGSTDPNNNIVSYAWTKISGPSSFSISRSDTAKTLVTNLVEGIYYFELLVKDAGGLSSKDTVMVIVSSPAAAQSIVAEAGPDQTITLPLDSTYLDGSNSTPNGWSNTSAVYTWTEVSGPSPALLIAPALFVQHYLPTTKLAKNLVPGDYTFSLEVKTQNAVSTDIVKIKVVNSPAETNTVTFHNVAWQTGDVYGAGKKDVFLTTSLKHDMFTTNALHVFLDINSDQNWQPVRFLNQTQFSYDARAEFLWIITYPADFTLPGKRSDLKVKIGL